jgi:hypothetical protein
MGSRLCPEHHQRAQYSPGDDLTLNSSTVLNLRYSFTRHHENQGGPPAYLSTDITSLGFPSSLASQVVYKQLPFMLFDDL